MTELIYCAAGNRRLAEIAIRNGFIYGAQIPAKVYFPIQFADQNWKDPNREKYMKALCENKPKLATVLDLEREDQLEEVLSWAEEASHHISESVIIIPKAFGIIDRIPEQINGKPIRLGYSVPTKFGATSIPVWEFRDRPVHLLGGSPQRQYELRNYLNVKSIDGNYSQKQAVQRCQFFAPSKIKAANGNFPQIREVSVSATEWKQDIPYLCFNLSCINIKNMWNYGPVCTIRLGVEEDVDQIVKISYQHKDELGYVMRPALKESIDRRSLFVAVHDNRVVGFVNSRTRKDGISVIYEIAVHRDWVGNNIGKCLLNAVPTPTRLKCTVDNIRGNGFYESSGFQLSAIEQGRKRELNVWEKQS